MLKKYLIQFGLLILVTFSVSAYTAAASIATDIVLSRASGDVLTIDTASLNSEEINELLAVMTDSEVRAELVRFLDSVEPDNVESSMEAAFSVRLLNGLQSLSIRLEAQWDQMLGSLESASTEYRNMLRNLTDNQGWSEIGSALLMFGLMVLIAGIVEWLVSRTTRSLRNRMSADSSGPEYKKIISGCMTLLFSFVGLIIFALVAYGVSLMFFERYDPLRVLTTTWLFTVTITRFARILFDVFIPGSDNKSLLNLSRDDGARICKVATAAVFVIAFGFLHNSFFVILGISEYLHRFITLISGIFVFSLLVVGLWSLRKRVADVWMSNHVEFINPASETLVKNWQIPATFLVSFTAFIWSLNVILGETSGAKAASIGLFCIVLIFFGRMVFNSLELQRKNRSGSDITFNIGGKNLGVPRLGYTLLLLIIGMAFYAESSGFGLSEFLATENGERLLSASLNVTVTVILAWVMWEMIRSAIDRYLPANSLEESQMEFDGEGGETAPATRAETLLPLLRKFLQFVLVVLVVLTLLASLGVNIAPLLAGAGVIGLAVGFGAQKLVQDVISGIFFLVDDAFRTGEYIETAGMRGTVEKISVRSLRLRHHLGPVQTVPYSEMATVKNHSRDYIIMKLSFRLPYDTDIEKVRKIIKKCGQKMLADDELGPAFLAPLKSQGVLQMEDSAMVMRMKFTAKPGEQWVIRREAYKRVRDALQAEGIEFAHRQVTVHIPSDITSDQKNKALGAAAIAIDETGSESTESKDVR